MRTTAHILFMKRTLVTVALVMAAASSQAQTEEDLLRWVEQNKPLADSGQVSQLEFHREMHRRISIIPADSYPHKLPNLRWIGRRIDVLEELEAGKITEAQARRRFAEVDAELEASDVARRQAREQADAERAAAIRQQQQQAAAQDEAARRALAAQILLGNMQRQAPVYQPAPITPYQIRPSPQVQCRSYRMGDQVHTACN